MSLREVVDHQVSFLVYQNGLHYQFLKDWILDSFLMNFTSLIGVNSKVSSYLMQKSLMCPLSNQFLFLEDCLWFLIIHQHLHSLKFSTFHCFRLESVSKQPYNISLRHWYNFGWSLLFTSQSHCHTLTSCNKWLHSFLIPQPKLFWHQGLLEHQLRHLKFLLLQWWLKLICQHLKSHLVWFV